MLYAFAACVLLTFAECGLLAFAAEACFLNSNLRPGSGLRQKTRLRGRRHRSQRDESLATAAESGTLRRLAEVFGTEERKNA